MAGNSATRVNQSGDNVQISFEDQQRINRFAQQNARLDDLKLELEMKKNELNSLQEGLDEIELFDEDEEIPFLVGEVFLVHKLGRTRELLAKSKDEIQKEIVGIEGKAKDAKQEIDELKTQLYQRFGNNISLDCDD